MTGEGDGREDWAWESFDGVAPSPGQVVHLARVKEVCSVQEFRPLCRRDLQASEACCLSSASFFCSRFGPIRHRVIFRYG